MQLVVLRIVFGAALLFVIREVAANAQAAPQTGGGLNTLLLAIGLFVALANAAVWAPYFGSKLSKPLTLTFTDGSKYEHRARLLEWARRAEAGGRRRLTAWFCLLETVLRPNRPAGYLMGLRNARSGSWFHVRCALRVFHFDNATHSVEAYRILRGLGLDPRPHRKPEVNALLMALERKPGPAPHPISLNPRTAPTFPRRDPRIRLFEGASSDAVPGGPSDPVEACGEGLVRDDPPDRGNA